MKTLTLILIFLTGLTNGPITQDLTIEATYTGVDDGMYTFVDDDGEEFGFSNVDAKAFKKFNLDTEDFIGEKFTVWYNLDTEVDEYDEEYDVYYIINLALIG